MSDRVLHCAQCLDRLSGRMNEGVRRAFTKEVPGETARLQREAFRAYPDATYYLRLLHTFSLHNKFIRANAVNLTTLWAIMVSDTLTHLGAHHETWNWMMYTVQVMGGAGHLRAQTDDHGSKTQVTFTSKPNSVGFNAVITKPWQFASRDAVNLRDSAGLYSSMAATYAAVPAGKLVVAQMSDHDSDRLASVLGNNTARQKVAAAIMFTQPFPPNIYYGDELGMRGTKAVTGTDADDIPMREPFKWKAVAGAPMSNYPAVTAGTIPPAFSANNDGRSVEEQRGVAGSLLETHRALIAVRKASPALRRGSYLPVTCPNSGVYAFVRHEASETVLVAINLNSGSTTTTLDLGAFTVPAAGTVPTSLENGSTLAAITAANRSSYPITLAARSWFIARAALTPPVDTSHADIDGRSLAADAGASALRATQSCLSSFGDNAGELNQLFVRADGDACKACEGSQHKQPNGILALGLWHAKVQRGG
jgi:hypothetical protein